MENSLFMNNSVKLGGPMDLHTSWVEIKGRNTFSNNSAALGGGAMCSIFSILEIKRIIYYFFW